MSDWPQSAPVNLLQSAGTAGASLATGTYFWTDGGSATIASGSGTTVPVKFLTLSAADWSGVSLLDLHVSLTTTVAQTGATFTFGLYPVTISGTTSVTFTLGTLVPGSTVAFVAPGAAAESRGTSGNFAVPAADLYIGGLVISGGSAAAGSRTIFTCTLRGTKT